MSDFSEINLPLNIIYSDVYSNVSGQVLEIDKELIPPGHLWSRLFADRVLIGDDYSRRGYITQKLIDLGYIAKAVYSPIIPQSYLFLQSYESPAWFEIDAVEVDAPGPYDLADDASFASTLIDSPPADSTINFDITVPYGNWFILELSTNFCLGMQIDDRGDQAGDPTFYYEKRNKLHYPAVIVPLSIPNNQQLLFVTEDNTIYQLRVNDAGQLFWLRTVAGVTPFSLFDPNGLFWQSIEPVLTGMAVNYQSVDAYLDPSIYVKALFEGSYAGTNGLSGALSFRWRAEDVAGITPGSYPIPENTSARGNWSVTGTLTVNP
jgi:hypothetical protein